MKKTFIGITIISVVCIAGCIYMYIDSAKILVEIHKIEVAHLPTTVHNAVVRDLAYNIFLLIISIAMGICSFILIISSKKYKHFEELNYLNREEFDGLGGGEVKEDDPH